MTAARLHLLTERLASLLRTNLRETATNHGLKLVQLEALIYLSVANDYSDTPMALAEYFGVTKGTVSQTLKVLERRGLVEKHPDDSDGRIQHCAVTRRGEVIVAEAYPAGCYADLGDTAAAAFSNALEQQLRALQRSNDFKTFGQCGTCRFFEPRSRGGHCSVTGEALSRVDATKICREHQNP